MLSCLVRHHICEIVSCCPVWLDNIYVNYHICLSYNVCTFNFFSCLSPFELEGVMAVSKGAKTRSSHKTVLPVDADRTMVVLAHKLAPPHIIETLPDCTLRTLGREPASPNLTQPQQIVTQFLLTQHHLHHRAPKQEQLVRHL